MWIPTAMQLLRSPWPAVQLQSVLTLAEACKYTLLDEFTSDDKPHLVTAALDVLSPYDTAVKRLAAARIFCCASVAQLPVVLPLLVGFMQHGAEPDCLIHSCESVSVLTLTYRVPLSQSGVATQVVSLLRHADPQVSSHASWLVAVMLSFTTSRKTTQRSKQSRCRWCKPTCSPSRPYNRCSLTSTPSAGNNACMCCSVCTPPSPPRR